MLVWKLTGAVDMDPTKDLISRALDRDPAAQRALFELVLPVIQASVANALRGRLPRVALDGLRAETADLVSDVWVALFDNGGERLRRWDPDRGPLAPFVGLVARHLVYSFLRRRGRGWTREVSWRSINVELLRAEDEDPEQRMEQEELAELREAVYAAVESKLTPDARKVFVLLVRDELTVVEVCKRTGLSANAIHVRRHRLQKLIQEAARRLVRGDLADE